MEDELPTQRFNPPPGTAAQEPADGIWLVSFADDDDRELTVRQISEALSRGQITPSTIVWRDGMPDWQPINALDSLRAALRRFTAEVPPPRKTRTVLGGFSADPSKLKETARLWNPGAGGDAAINAGDVSQQQAEALARVAAKAPPAAGAAVPTQAATGAAREPAFKVPPPGSPIGKVESMREEPHAFALNRHLDKQQTPTARLPKVQPAQAADAPRGETQAKARSVPHSPQRPSRPPPERSPSKQPPTPMFNSEPASLFPEALEALPSDALLSVVAELPAPKVPSAPAIFDVNLTPQSEVEIDVAEPVTSAPERAGDSILVGPAPADELIQVANPADDRRATAIAAAAAPAPSLHADSVPGSSGSVSGAALPAATSPAAHIKSSYESHPLPPPAPKKRSRLGLFLLALLFGGALLAIGFFLGQKRAGVHEEPLPAVVTEVANPSPKPVASATSNPVEQAEATKTGAMTQKETPVPAPRKPRRSAPAARTPSSVAAKSVATKPEPTPPTEAKAVAAKPKKSVATKASDPTESSAAGPKAFDKGAAVSALRSAGASASSCRKPGDPSGVARVMVTFSNSGRATRAVVSGPPFSGTQTGGCIASKMRSARIPAFSGDRVTVTKKVVIQ